jgi:hypothetical protein
MDYCPACGSRIEGEEFCSWCGLEQAGADAEELRALMSRLAAIDTELYVRSRDRDDVANQLAAKRYALVPAPPVSPAVVAVAPPRQEWSVDRVRSVLLWVGATLLAVSALTFTAVAWSHLSDGGRATLLFAFTGVALLLALATRGRLPATAEAFTALSVALGLVDWYAIRRAGFGLGISTTGWWAFGSVILGLLAFALGEVTAPNVGRRAAALLIPVGAVLTIAVSASAPWSVGLGLALLAGALTFVRTLLPDDWVLRELVGAEAIAVWIAGAVATAIAASQPDTLASVVTPSIVVLSLGVAPAIVRRLELVIGVVLGALVTVAAPGLAPDGLAAFAAVCGLALVAISPLVPARHRDAPVIAGIAYAIPGVAWFATVAAVTTFGPLRWFHFAWTGDLHTVARAVVSGPNTGKGELGSAAVLFVAVAGAIALLTTLRNVALAAIVLLAGVCMAPVVLGASAGVALAVALGAGCATLVAAAFIDNEYLLPVALVALVPAAGWAVLTSAASIVALVVVVVVAAVSAAIARSELIRLSTTALGNTAAIAIAGVASVAAGAPASEAGFVVVAVAGAVFLIGARARLAVFEVVGGAGMIAGALLSAPSTSWLACSFTLAVPVFALAALRRDRAIPYGAAAGASALAATWAWLAVAHVTVVEAYTLPAAAAALGAGLVSWRRGPGRSWLALGPAIVIALGPTLDLAIKRDDPTRSVLVATVAVAVVLVGAWQRLQAPLVLGSAALLILAIDTFGPAAARLPRWVPLAVAGVLLMWVGARFERSREAIHRASQTFQRFG